MSRYRAICDKVIVQRDPVVEKTSNVFMPDNMKKKTPPRVGTVLSVGEEVKYTKVGDRVVFTEYSGHSVKETQDLVESDILSMHEYEILTILPSEEQ